MPLSTTGVLTAFAFLVDESPANCRTNSPRGKSLPPALAWAMWLKTNPFKESTEYQCGLVGCDGTYFFMSSRVDL